MDWKDVKPGDKVAFIRTGIAVPQAYTVERVTKTQIVLDGCDLRLNRSTGRRVGGSMWSERWTCDPAEIARAELDQERWRVEARLEVAVVQAAQLCKSVEAIRRLEASVEAACAEAREGV